MEDAMRFDWSTWLSGNGPTDAGEPSPDAMQMPWWLTPRNEREARVLLAGVAAVLEAVLDELVEDPWPEQLQQLSEQVTGRRDAALDALITLAVRAYPGADRSTPFGMLGLIGTVEHAVRTGHLEAD